MTEHRIGTQEEWEAARDELLEAEKETEDGTTTYEIEIKNDGKTLEVEVSPEGTILEVEEEGDDGRGE